MSWPPDTYDDDIEQHILALDIEHQIRMARLVLAGWQFRHVSQRLLGNTYTWRWQVRDGRGASIHESLSSAIDCEWFNTSNEEIRNADYREVGAGTGSVQDEPQSGHGCDVPECAARG